MQGRVNYVNLFKSFTIITLNCETKCSKEGWLSGLRRPVKTGFSERRRGFGDPAGGGGESEASEHILLLRRRRKKVCL